MYRHILTVSYPFPNYFKMRTSVPEFSIIYQRLGHFSLKDPSVTLNKSFEFCSTVFCRIK